MPLIIRWPGIIKPGSTCEEMVISNDLFPTISELADVEVIVKDMDGMGDILAGATHGPCDLKSKWGGVFFYGIHQVEMVLKAFGYNVSSVLVTKNGNGATGQLIYSDGKIVTMNLIKNDSPGFSITAVGKKGVLHKAIAFDKNIFLNGIKIFTEMFKTGKEPLSRQKMLKPVLVLEALEKSVKSGVKEKVEK